MTDRERFERELDEGCRKFASVRFWWTKEPCEDRDFRLEQAERRFVEWRAKFINNWAPRKEAINGS